LNDEKLVLLLPFNFSKIEGTINSTAMRLKDKFFKHDIGFMLAL
jgi:hypothetical protein